MGIKFFDALKAY